MKSIVIITAHPEKDSLSMANADALESGAKKQKFSVTRFDACAFPWVDHNPIKKGFPREFEKVVEALAGADAIAVCCPMWNYGAPATLKNFLDGVIQSPKLFHFVPNPFLKNLVKIFPFLKTICPTAQPEGYMKARRVLCVWTADGPEWFYSFFPSHNVIFPQVKQALKFCGARGFRQKFLGMTRNRSEKAREKWLKSLETYRF
ncbi:NAD(P)H-dependent oxidoreductase [Candidatus Gracilibacteria bacterium]|nr:NAD(P)H-dependent oxidoreductase [Candidatus Gracilibacteria bacterium]